MIRPELLKITAWPPAKAISFYKWRCTRMLLLIPAEVGVIAGTAPPQGTIGVKCGSGTKSTASNNFHYTRRILPK
jgi:hypothetical protein